MIHLTIPQLAGIVAWLATTLLVLALYAIDRRRQKRIQRLLEDPLFPARDAVTRHQWAQSGLTTSDERAAFDRTMEILAQAVQSLDQGEEAPRA